MPYLLRTPEGYICDLDLARGGNVKTCRAEAHVAHTLEAAMALREVVMMRGGRVGILGVTPWPIIRPEDDYAGEAAFLADIAQRWNGGAP